MAGGRPTDYKPEMCAQVIEWGREGLSLVEMAANLDICKFTINKWRDEIPEFSAAITKALTLSEAVWTKEGKAGLWEEYQGRKMNSRIYELQMQNRFGWSRKIQQSVDLQQKELSKLTTDELIEQYKKAGK